MTKILANAKINYRKLKTNLNSKGVFIMTSNFVAPTGFVIRDSNGLFVDQHSLQLDTIDKKWVYHGNKGLAYTRFNSFRDRTEKILKKLTKVNELAGFDVDFHIEEVDYDNMIKIHTEFVSEYIPVPKGTITKLRQQLKEIKWSEL